MQCFSSLLLLLTLLLLLLSKLARGDISIQRQYDGSHYYYYYYETGSGLDSTVIVWSDNNNHWTETISNKPSGAEQASKKCPENAEYTDCVSPCPWTCDRIKEFQFFAVRDFFFEYHDFDVYIT